MTDREGRATLGKVFRTRLNAAQEATVNTAARARGMDISSYIRLMVVTGAEQDVAVLKEHPGAFRNKGSAVAGARK